VRSAYSRANVNLKDFKRLFHLLLFVLMSVVLLGTAPFGISQTVTLVHSNDMHGIYKPYKWNTNGDMRLVGGMEALSHYVNHLRAREEHMLLLDCGDIMTGTIAARIDYRGVAGGIMVEFLNRIGYDLWAYGNHAFDQGTSNLRKLTALADFPVIMANIVEKESGKRFAEKAYHIFERGGLRIGVVAVMEENFLIEVHTPRIEGLDVVPIIPSLQSLVAEMDDRTDLIVVLLHSKFNVGEKVAREVSGIDVVLTASEEGRFKNVGGVLVQSTFGHQKTLGCLRVEVKDDKVVDFDSNLIWLWADEELQPSESVSELVEELQKSVSDEFNRVVGKAEWDQHRKGRPVECPLGNWITDAMRWETGAKIAFQNSGGIRSDILAGPITKGDVYKVSPFDNTLITFKISGQQVKDVLEHDIERGWDRLQMSGIHYAYYPKSERPRGQRVQAVVVNDEILVKEGEVLHPDAIYTAVSNSYVTGHAEDKYFGFPISGTTDTNRPLKQVLLEWLDKFGRLDYDGENRIVEIHARNP